MADPGFFYHPFSDLKGYDTVVARNLAREVRPEFWDRGQLFATAHGFLLSHAGVAAAFWPVRQSSGQAAAESVEEASQACWKRAKQMSGPPE